MINIVVALTSSSPSKLWQTEVIIWMMTKPKPCQSHVKDRDILLKTNPSKRIKCGKTKGVIKDSRHAFLHFEKLKYHVLNILEQVLKRQITSIWDYLLDCWKKSSKPISKSIGLACPTCMQFLTCTNIWNLKTQNVTKSCHQHSNFKLLTNGLDESIRSKLTDVNGIEKLLKRVDIVASYAPVSSVFPMSYDFLKFWEANWDMQDFIHTYYNFH